MVCEMLEKTFEMNVFRARFGFMSTNEFENLNLLAGAEPSDVEIAMLDLELEAFVRNPIAGSPWREVEARLRNEAVV